MSCDPAVEADLVVGETSQVTAEASEVGVELFEDDGLGLDFADLLGDDPLGHLLEDDELLLDDLNTLCAADKLLLLDDDLVEVGSIKVIHAIEVVEVVQGSKASPVVECREAPGSQFEVRAECYRTSQNSSGQGGDVDKLNGEFCEHG